MVRVSVSVSRVWYRSGGCGTGRGEHLGFAIAIEHTHCYTESAKRTEKKQEKINYKTEKNKRKEKGRKKTKDTRRKQKRREEKNRMKRQFN